jgi:hypothetical protein
MDVIEDLRGKSIVVLVAEANGIDPYSMRFISPRYNYGHPGIYERQFASGWASPDFDGDAYPGNCATLYSYVTPEPSPHFISQLAGRLLGCLVQEVMSLILLEK